MGDEDGFTDHSGDEDESHVFLFEAHDDLFTNNDKNLLSQKNQTPERVKQSTSFIVRGVDSDLDAEELDISYFESQIEQNDVSIGHKQRVDLSCFSILRVIGKGAYGKVFLVERKSTSNLYAMKVLKKASLIVHGKEHEHNQNERSILESIRHPFIVSLCYAFQTSAKLYLILSYASGGELFTYLAQEKMFSDDQARFYIAELILAVEHLHGLGIIYRDLKPENVLLGCDGHIILTDFGLSKVAIDARTICGTIEFMAPEVLNERMPYGKAVDFWSIGIMMYDMLTGAPPFSGGNRRKIMEAILNKKPKFPKYMTIAAIDLCTKLLKKSPPQRLGYGEDGANRVKAHVFFKHLKWESLLAKEIPPPYIPIASGRDDTSNFSPIFTSMEIESPPATIDINFPVAEEEFLGFSYVNSQHK